MSHRPDESPSQGSLPTETGTPPFALGPGISGSAFDDVATVKAESRPDSGPIPSDSSASRKSLSTRLPSPEGVSTHGGLHGRPADEEPAGPWDTLAGVTLGRYHIIAKLGEGGMAVVYRALDHHLGRTVALKIPKLRPGDTDMEARFLREARAAAALHHSGICPIHDVGQIDGIDYLSMAFIDGEPLSRLISPEQPFDPRDAVFLVRKLALALAEAHDLGIVHRDLKPSNVMMNRHGEPIVMDFGLARRWDGADAPLTYSGAILGTPAYMSPEQVEGSSDAVGPASDIYSLGVVLFELLTGRRPFVGSTAAILGYIAVQPAPAPSTLRPEIPPALDAICLQALSKRPADRFPSMRAFAAALEEFAQSSATLRVAAEGNRSSTPGEPRSAVTPQCDLQDRTPKVHDLASRATLPMNELEQRATGSGVAPAAGVARPESSTGVADGTSTKSGVLSRMPARDVRRWAIGSAVITAAAVVAIFVVRPLFSPRTDKESPSRPAGAGVARASQAPAESTSAAAAAVPAPNTAKLATLSLPDSTNWRALLDEEALNKPVAPAAEKVDPLAQGALELFRAKCADCHSSDKRNGGLTILDYDSLLHAPEKPEKTEKSDKSDKPADRTPFITPRMPGESRIWRMVEADKMPQDEPLDAASKSLLRDWITAGAPRWGDAANARPFVSEVAVLTAVRDDLAAADARDRRYLRYFSLSALHNSRNVSDDALRLTRAAVSKAANSLSWEHAIAAPTLIGNEGAVLRIDLRDYGWDRQSQWDMLLAGYPYAASYVRDRDDSVRKLEADVAGMTGADVPIIRGDWFVATATRPPLYGALLELPGDLAELEKRLRVDVIADFQRDRLVRGGVLQSGISRNNVVVDRHSSSFGGYWRSFDFAMSTGRGDILQYPLGPAFPGNELKEFAFEHDLVKAIFRLPNGLQGYFLSDAQGRRIDEGAVNVIRDPGETSGTPAVVTGLSCMACHSKGTITFDDAARAGLAVDGDAEQKARRLFGDGTKMQELLDADRRQFLEAALQATGAFLQTADAEKAGKSDPARFPEPVSAVARSYARDVGLEEAAFELGLNHPARLRTEIEKRLALRKLGLGPLVAGGRIKRSVWSARLDGLSLCQKAALELGIAVPP